MKNVYTVKQVNSYIKNMFTQDFMLAADHYEKLEKTASDCISCGHCDRRCPFHVGQSERMKKIAGYFGK